MNSTVSGFFALAYALACLGVVIYIITLIVRFVRAHERVASALETMARKPQDDRKP
jgi:hypothetical protein